MDNHFFRSALNGFNRQDVIEYIERSQREAADRVLALEQQINELNRIGSELRGNLEKCTQERDALSVRFAEVTQVHEQAQCELAQLRGELDQLKEEVRVSSEEQAVLGGQLEEMRSEVAAARREKESVAQLELEARKRSEELMDETRVQAEELLNQARAQVQALLTAANEQAENTVRSAYERAEEIRSAMEAQVGRTGEEASELIASVETIAAHVAAELRKMDVAVAQLPINFNHLKDGLKELQEQAADRSVLQE